MKANLGQLTDYLSIYIIQYTCILIGFCFFAYTEVSLVPRSTNVKFRVDDPSISKSHVADEVVSGTECLSIAWILPTLVITIHCLLGRISKRRLAVSVSDNKTGNYYMLSRPNFILPQLHLLQISLTCLGLILIVNGIATNILKLFIGNMRPDFIDRCLPLIPIELKDEEYFPLEICKQPNKAFLYEGLKSTPSGHSSFIVCSMAYLFWWQTYFVKCRKVNHIWCVILALVVIISRLTDHRHHWYDLISGSLVGLTSFIVCWKFIFQTNKKVEELLPSSK